MQIHPAFSAQNVAVITGAADGIGLAAGHAFAASGMRVCLVDIDEDGLASAQDTIPEAMIVSADVSDLAQLQTVREQVYRAWGRVDVLMNNAATFRPTGAWSEHEHWQRVLNVNLWGVINGLHAFTAAMMAQKTPGLIINTASKQGITNPPGNPAYNVSKAGVKTLTEALQHELRTTEDCQLGAHLLVPGFTYTGMVKSFLDSKPAGAWEPRQVVEFMMASVSRGDFYILCPDNEVTREVDNPRMAWAMGDLIHNRPALSRWHPDYQEEFERFVSDQYSAG